MTPYYVLAVRSKNGLLITLPTPLISEVPKHTDFRERRFSALSQSNTIPDGWSAVRRLMTESYANVVLLLPSFQLKSK